MLSSVALDSSDTAYVTTLSTQTSQSTIHAVTRSGIAKWTLALESAVVHSSPAIAKNGTIYPGLFSGQLIAVSPAGRILKTYTTGGSILSSPLLLDDGKLIVGSDDYFAYVIETGQGPMTNSAWPMHRGNAQRTGQAKLVINWPDVPPIPHPPGGGGAPSYCFLSTLVLAAATRRLLRARSTR